MGMLGAHSVRFSAGESVLKAANRSSSTLGFSYAPPRPRSLSKTISAMDHVVIPRSRWRLLFVHGLCNVVSWLCVSFTQ